MLDSLLGVLGILVSVVLFFVGYRQTVGAKKERIAACNSEVEKILLRRIVLESYTPSRADVGRLVEGKARDFRVRADDLLSEAQVLNGVYTRVVESDLIPAEQRNEIVGRIIPALVETEARPVDEIVDEAGRWKVLSETSAALTGMAVLASGAGALVAALPELANLDSRFPTFFRTLVLTATASLGVLVAWILLYRLRSSQEELSTRGTEAERYLRFEREVAHLLKGLGFRVRPMPPGMVGDFLVEHGQRRFVIEVKAWPRRVPGRLLAETAHRLSSTAEAQNAEIIIVTRVPMLELADTLPLPNVRVLSHDQLRDYMAQQLIDPRLKARDSGSTEVD